MESSHEDISLLQGFVEETAEFQVGVDDTARRRRLRVNRRKAIVQAEIEPVPVREAVKCYCTCMQVMLQASGDQQQTFATKQKHVAKQLLKWQTLKPTGLSRFALH